MIVKTDEGTGVAYIHGRCTHCRKEFILKFYGAAQYKCPGCKKPFILRRNR